MNAADIARMAREAGPLINTPFDIWCERFATLVAFVERERCAEACERLADSLPMNENENVYLAARTIRNMEAA